MSIGAQVPDYTKANENFEKGQCALNCFVLCSGVMGHKFSSGKTVTHQSGSLGDIVSNLVKNWEKEMSYKTVEEELRTVDAQ